MLRRNAAESAPVAGLLRDADAEIRSQVAKVLGDAAMTAAKNEGKALVRLLADEAPRTRVQAAIALAKYREPTAVDGLFSMAAKDGNDPVLRHAAATGLTACATVQQLTAKRTDAAVTVRLASVIALRRQNAAAVAEFLRDTEPRVVEEAARAIHDDL